MNHKTKIISACVISGLLITSIAQASFLDAVTYSCSSSLTFGSGAGDEATCSGDFSLSDGVLNNSSYIKLNALGKLTFAGTISLTAPLIELSASSIFINGSLASFTAENLIIQSGALTLNDPHLSTPPIGDPSNVTISNGGSLNIGGSGSNVGNFTGGLSSGGAVIHSGDPFISIGGSILDTGLGGQIQLPFGQITLLNSIPEPTSYALLLAGLSLIGFTARKKS